MDSFVIPADYCVALIDAAAYPSFVDSNWTLPQIREHFVAQMNRATILAWGTGAPGNWRISVATGRGTATKGYREFTSRITATGNKLHLTSYDELTMAAQVEDVKLPRKGTDEWFIPVGPGDYECRVVQLYDPAQAESEEVFNQELPHFLIKLTQAQRGTVRATKQVPWFIEGS
jgi:hypothetical protein